MKIASYHLVPCSCGIVAPEILNEAGNLATDAGDCFEQRVEYLLREVAFIQRAVQLRPYLPRGPFCDEEESDELPRRLPLEALCDIGRDGNGRAPNLVAKSKIS